MAKGLESLHDSSESQGEMGRRRLFSMGALAVGSSIASAMGREDPAPAPAPPPGTPNPGVYKNWTDPALRLARRITQGMDADTASQAKQLGYDRFLSQQINFSAIDDSACENVVKQKWPRVLLPIGALKNFNDDWVTSQQVAEATIYRSIYSKRQLFQRMVEFWVDHFNVWIDAVPGPIFATYNYDRIRRNAMGNFKTLLRSVAFSPAMLHYLNADRNFCSNPNVNFARELMELHTISSSGGYTPQDIVSVALAFTGWRWEWDRNKKTYGTFKFEMDAHAIGAKVVLGEVIPGGMREEGERVLDILAAHPNCAKFITAKLCRWFLGEDAPQTVLDAAAAAFTRTGGDIKTVLRTILAQDNVVRSAPRYKRPYHLFINGLRSSKAALTGDMWTFRVGHLERAGHAPFQWETPDGYPDRFEFWSDAALPRINFALNLANNRIWGMTCDIPAMIGADRDPDRVRDILNFAYFGGEMSTVDRDALEQFLRGGLLTDERLRGAAALCMASPSFQWY
ncbi:MAG: DUF1800 domain-containing protein [Fimbriimonadaceae bacterium]|nr:DUF1800 domain-containing protein [Fimbriimonadaceae bacterium]QYK54910.1 MAG: DUF1800 domain-containing protein [Fimbriimonadaceae bacterium]